MADIQKIKPIKPIKPMKKQRQKKIVRYLHSGLSVQILYNVSVSEKNYSA